MFTLQTTPYVSGRAKGFIRLGRAAATRDGLVVLTQQELVNFEGPCRGLIVINGQPFSQSMVRVLGHAMPTVTVTSEQAAQLREGDELVLDGASGMLFDPALLETMPAAESVEPADLFEALQTLDQKSITLRADVSNRMGVTRSLSSGARGITLRMEFIGGKSRTPPPTEFFITELNTCGHEAEPLPLTIALPDYTNEKLPLWCAEMAEQLAGAGTRGIRLYRQEPFRTIVFSILEGVAQNSDYYDIRVMLPYVTTLEEFREWRELVDTSLPVPITLGVSLDNLAAATMVAEFLDEADFVMVSTDDLMINLFAAQGGAVDHINPYAPALYRLLRQIALNAGERACEIQLSGQLARMPGVLPVLIGLGYRLFSADPLFVTRLSKVIPKINCEKAEALADAVCNAHDVESAKRAMRLM